MTAVQSGPTSIRVSWTPPTPLGNTTGYIIYYTNDVINDSGSVNIDDGSTNEYTLTGLQNGETYNISIVAMATSQHLPSDALVMEVTLSKPTKALSFFKSTSLFSPIGQPGLPEQPSVSVLSVSDTAISLSWMISNSSIISHSEVVWSSVTDEEAGSSGNLTTETRSFTIQELDSSTIYNITIFVSNIAVTSNSQPIIVSTGTVCCYIIHY